MAISDTQKIDDLYKKLVFGVTKTDIAGNKSPSNEAIPSPLLVRGDTLWNGSGLIPSTPPGASEGVVAVHTGTSKVAATSDPTVVPATRTWITGSNNWIPPQFGSGYTVKVYADTLGASNPQVTGTLLPPDGINNDAYIFDYQAGVLNFADTNLPAALTGKYIFIVGYTYTGTFGVSNNTSIGDLTIVGSTLGTSVTNGNVTIDANGTGAVVLNDQTTVNGALTVIGAVTSTTSVSAPALNGNVTATGLSTFANVDINSGTIDATVIGATTRAAGSFTTVTGGTATFASINNTPIGNAVPSTGAFTTLDANGNVNITGQAQSTLTSNGVLVVAGGVGIAKNLNVGGNAIVAGDLTVQGTITTVNSTTVDIADVNLTLASNATNPAQADGAGLTINGAAATMLYSGTNDDWTFNKNVNIPNLHATGNISAVGALSAASSSITGVASAGTVSTANAQVTGGSVTGLTTLGATNGTVTNLTSSNVAITGGTATGLTTLGATNGTVTNLASGNVSLTGGALSGVTVNATSLTTANAQVTGGNVTGLTNLGSTNGTVTNLTSSNVAITGGTESGVTITSSPISGASGSFTTLQSSSTTGLADTTASSLTTSNAQISGGAITGTPISGSTGSFTSVSTANAQVTGGSVTGLSAVGATTATFTTTNAGNLQATSGTVTGLTTVNATNSTITNLSSGNAIVTGGNITNTPISGSSGSFTNITAGSFTADSINNTPIGNATPSTGAFTFLSAGNVTHITDNTQSTVTSDGALIVTGGVGIGRNLNVGGDTIIGGNLTVQGQTTTVNSTTVSTTDVNITVAQGATAKAQADGAGLTVGNYASNPTLLFSGTNDDWTFNRNVNIPNLGVTGNITAGGDLGVTGNAGITGTATLGTLSTTNAQVTGGAISGLSSLGATTATFTTTNAGNLQATSGTVTGLTTLTATNGTVTNFTTGNAQVTGGDISGAKITTSNAQISGGAITGTPISGSTGSFTTLTTSGAAGVNSLVTANAQITGGNITGTPFSGSTVNATTLTTADAQITGGSVTGLATFSITNGTVTNLSSSNVAVTGGTVSGLTTLGATNGTVTNLASGNVSLTGGNATGLTNVQATNLASGNVTVTGGTINATTIGGTTPAVGTFSQLFTSNAQITGGVISGTTIDITSIAASNVAITGGYIDGTVIGGNVAAAGSFTTLHASGITHITDLTQSTVYTDGALIVDGGVGIAKNLNVGQNVVITGNLQVNGVTTTVNSSTVDVADINITIAKGALTASAANGAGITVDGPANATITYAESSNTWNLNLPTVASEFRGNVVGTNLTGTLQTAAQPNVTSLGTLSSLGVTGQTSTGSLVTGNAQITGGSIAGTTSMNITDGTVTNLTSSNVAITGGSITTTAGSFTTLAASTSLNATTSGAITLESGTLGTMNNVTIGETTRAAAYFTDVTGGLATFAALNGTIIGNTSAAAGTFTSINGNDVTVSTVYTVGIEANGTSTLNTVSANTVTVNTELVSNTAATFNGTVTTNGAATFNDTITANNQVTLSPATGTVTINPINQGSIDNVTVNAVTLTSEQVALLGGYIDGTIIGANVPAAGYFSTLSGGSFSASSINDTPIGNASPSTGDFTTLSSTLGITGDLVTSWQPNITLLGTLQSLVVTGEANLGILLTGNAQITGGNIYSTPIGAGGASSGLFTSVGATTGFTGSILTAVQTGITTVGTLGNLAVSGNAQVNGTATVGTLSTTNAQITGGAITSTPISGSTGQFSVLTSANVALTGGNISGTAIGYGPAGAAAGTFTTFSADNGTITNFASGNVNVTGGAISGVGITSSNGSFNTLSGIDTSATNFTTSNAHINGGAITSTPISGSTGSFTTLTTSSTAKFEGVLTANNGAESYSTITGALQVVGGAGVTGNVNVGNGLWVNANKSAQPAVFKGVTDNTLLYVRPSTNQIMFGGNVSDANIATAFVPNATVIFNSTDSVLLPSGTTGQRPGVGSEVKGMTRFNTTFNYMEYWNGTVWASTDTVFTLITDQQFVGNGLTTNFALSTPSTTNATIVSINGVVQIPGLAYSVATSTLQFDEAPLSTDVIDVRILVTTQTISGMASPNGFNQIIPDDTDISVWTGTSSSTQRWKWDAATGNLLPVGPNMDIGSPTAVVDNIYVSNVIVSGGSISGVSFTLSSIDNTPIGQSVAAAGTFAQLSTNTGLALTAGAPLTADQTGVAVVTNTVIDSFAKATYRSAKYVVSITSGSNIQTAEVLVIHDGTNTAITTYGVLALVGGAAGAPFVTFTAGVNGSNIELKATGTGTAKVQRTYVAV